MDIQDFDPRNIPDTPENRALRDKLVAEAKTKAQQLLGECEAALAKIEEAEIASGGLGLSPDKNPDGFATQIARMRQTLEGMKAKAAIRRAGERSN